MAKILTNQELLSINGAPLINHDSNKTFTLKSAIINSLMAQYQGEENLSGEEKLKRFEMALRVQKEDVIDLTSEEILYIKGFIGKAYPLAVVGPAFMILEGREDQLPPRLVILTNPAATDPQPH